MDIIRLLPDSVANQIAAGEVIQRPASCLKELVENSLDAGATHIQVIVRDAGRTLLQVIDNGSGMSETDARMAFERHATSKIKEAADLFRLRTMGFRGEALASICAVAHVEVLTRRQEDEIGTLLEIAGSDVVRQELAACPVGTNIKVKNLFYNVPVRRKFLKTDQTELRNLIQDFYRIVLVWPQVQFTLVHNDEILFDLPAGTEKQRIGQLFSRSLKQDYTSHFVDIKVESELVSIHGFVGKPESAGKQPQQYLFVNGRYMRHPYFHKAILTAYAGTLGADMNPSYFVYFDVDPESIDVNIHPTKTEIKFQDEQMIFQILLAAVREALGKFNVSPSLDFDVEGRPDMPVSRLGEQKYEMPRISNESHYNPFHSATQVSKDWQKLYEGLPKSQEPIAEPVEREGREQTLFTVETPTGTPTAVGNRYIVVPDKEGILLIHRVRARACVLYDIYMRQIRAEQGVREQLLFPDIWDLNAEQVPTVLSLKDDLRYLGFELEQLSPLSFSVNAVPPQLNGQNALAVLQNILAEVTATGSSVREEWQKSLALSLAYSAAGGQQTMTEGQMRELMDQLFHLNSFTRTPDGKMVLLRISEDEIARKF